MAVSDRIGGNVRVAPFCAIACVILGVFFLGLGGLRLYSLSLENHLSQLSQRTEKASEELAYLQMQLASLVSPQKIYGTARTALGMVPPSYLALVRIPSGLSSGSSGRQPLVASEGERHAQKSGFLWGTPANARE
ncbi:hypothetical protein [Aminiphilus sp.]|jgi:hypothetical protein|uniref:hypothetical protein n=1 Tax=Aminiphilus sp. TaxID=1872488 RepID=UPI00261D232D|nr:hypothetical protein [Aminiphilus sp.]